MTHTLHDGDLITKAPTEIYLYSFEWDDQLPPAASIQTSTCAAVALNPSTATLLTLDFSTFNTRTSTVRVSGGVDGALYRITNTVTTDEFPSQVFVAFFDLEVAV